MDSRLRSILFESICHIEIAFRTQLELAMSAGYGSRWYEKDSFFFNKMRHTRDLSELSSDWARSDEDFKRHYEEKYAAAFRFRKFDFFYLLSNTVFNFGVAERGFLHF